MTLKCPLNVVVFSDVHLGHKNTPTQSIIDNLMTVVPDTRQSEKIDMVIISGDLYDRFLTYPQEETYLIEDYLMYLIRLCKKWNIALRVLEGTPSHDWKQSRHIDMINKGMSVQADVKYVETLSIEHIEQWGIDILYIPDEWSNDNEDTRRQVEELMSLHGLSQVDFTVMHGQFAYQLPEHVKAPVHNPEFYADITRHYVFCGHVHKPSRYRNIIVPGSFDRISHGEEHAKGHWVLNIDPNGEDVVTFVENKNSTIYKTIECDNVELETVLSQIDKEVDGLPKGSHVRIWTSSNTNPIARGKDVLVQRYPTIRWSYKFDKTNMSRSNTLNDTRVVFKTIPITAKTVSKLVEDHFRELSIPDEMREDCLRKLESVK